jgi:hypothetical protein
LATRRFNRQRNGYRMRCKPPWTSTATAWYLVSPAGPSPLLTAGKTVPTRGLPASSATTDSTEGMPWALMVLSWVPHQMPLHGDRCSPVRRQSPSASSGGLWLPQILTHPHTVTPARRGRCTADMGAKRCEPAPRSGRAMTLRYRCQRRQLPDRPRAADRTWRPCATTHRRNAGKRGNGGQHDNWPGRSAGE